MKEQISTLKWEHREALQNLREEMLSKYYKTDQDEQISTEQSRKINNAKTMDEKERIMYESKINELVKTKKQQSSDIERLKKRINVLQQKYDNNMKQMFNYKRIRKDSQQMQIKEEKKSQIHQKNEEMMGEIDNLIVGFGNRKKSQYIDERKSSDRSFIKN